MSASFQFDLAPVRTRRAATKAAPPPAARPTDPIRLRRITACIDGSPYSASVLAHAARAATALDAELILLRVVEPRTATLPDPVASELRKREARDELVRLAADAGLGSRAVKAEVIEGDPAEKIRNFVRDNAVDLTVLSTHGDRGMTDWGMGGTARKLLESVPGSLLLIPAEARGMPRDASYRTVLVPLDGSSHAESVLPLATRIASGSGAAVVLAHVVPVPELTETAPMEKEARDLRERLVRRNQRVANEYLQRVRLQTAGDAELRTTSHVADARGGLAQIIAEEHPDLVVLSAHGQGRRADVPFGTVAGYLIDRSRVPLLVVRGRSMARVRSDQAPIRLPSHAGK